MLGKTILKQISKKQVVRHGLNSIESGNGRVAGSCEHGNELSGSIKGGKFLDWLSKYLRLEILVHALSE
jgi:hypothetical protein